MVWDKYKKSQWKMNYSMQIYHLNKYTIYEIVYKTKTIDYIMQY